LCWANALQRFACTRETQLQAHPDRQYFLGSLKSHRAATVAATTQQCIYRNSETAINQSGIFGFDFAID
jgi:hypothetical protein